jgi:hypothetical protein
MSLDEVGAVTGEFQSFTIILEAESVSRAH